MNRIQQWPLSTTAPQLRETADAPTGFSETRASSLRKLQTGAGPSSAPTPPCSLFTPMHYERNYAYPLLVWLHGPNDDQRQVHRVMPFVSLRNYVAVGPQAPTPAPGGGRQWRLEDEEAATQRIFDSIDFAASRLNVAPRRVFLGGFLSGGEMALQIALHHPARFAGALSLGGGFPRGNTPLRNLDAARRLPLFLTCGRDASQYTVAESCEQLKLFHAASLNVSLRQYPVRDELDSLMLHDTDVWLMEQVTGVRQSCEAPSRDSS